MPITFSYNTVAGLGDATGNTILPEIRNDPPSGPPRPDYTMRGGIPKTLTTDAFQLTPTLIDPPSGYPRLADYTVAYRDFALLNAPEPAAAIRKRSYDLSPRWPRFRNDQTWALGPLPELFGKDIMTAGFRKISYDLSPRQVRPRLDETFTLRRNSALVDTLTPERNYYDNDYSNIRAPWYRSTELNLQDSTLAPSGPPPGEDIFDLAPISKPYIQSLRTWVQEILPLNNGISGVPVYQWAPLYDLRFYRSWELGETVNIPTGTPPGEDVFDLPPISKPYIQHLRTWTQDIVPLAGGIAGVPVYQWEPLYNLQFYRSWETNLQESTLFPTAANPFVTTVDELPIRALPLGYGWVFNLQGTTLNTPIGETVSDRPPVPAFYRSWERNAILISAPVGKTISDRPPVPAFYRSWEFNPQEIPLETPVGKTISDRPPVPAFYRDWAQWRFLGFVDQFPQGENLYDRPPPVQFYRSWELNLNTNTLFPTATPFVGMVTDRPPPVQFYRSWERWRYPGLVDQFPQGQNVTDRPPPRPFYRSWEFNLQLTTLNAPIGEQYFDRPPVPPFRRSWEFTLQQSIFFGTPIGENYSERPPPKQFYRSWELNLQSTLTAVTFPAGEQVFDAPFRSIPIRKTWSPDRVQQAADTPKGFSFDLPIRQTQVDHTWIATTQLTPAVTYMLTPTQIDAPDRPSWNRTWTLSTALFIPAARSGVPVYLWEPPSRPPPLVPSWAQWRFLGLVDQYPQGTGMLSARPPVPPFYRSWEFELQPSILIRTTPFDGMLYDRPPVPPFYRSWEFTLPTSDLFGTPVGENISDRPPVPPFYRSWELNLQATFPAVPVGEMVFDRPPVPAFYRSWEFTIQQSIFFGTPIGENYFDRPPVPPFYRSWELNLQNILPTATPFVGMVYDRPPVPPFYRSWEFTIQQSIFFGTPVGENIFDRPPVPPFYRSWELNLQENTLFAATPFVGMVYARPPVPPFYRSWELGIQEVILSAAPFVGMVYDRPPVPAFYRSWEFTIQQSILFGNLPAGENYFDRPPPVQFYRSWELNINPLVPTAPAGANVYDTTPRGPAPLLQTSPNYFSGLLPTPQQPVGVNIFDRPMLAIPGALSWTASRFGDLQDQFPSGAISFDRPMLPIPLLYGWISTAFPDIIPPPIIVPPTERRPLGRERRYIPDPWFENEFIPMWLLMDDDL